MQKINVDLSEKKYADQSKNDTVIKGMLILYAVLLVAYAIEVIKGGRTPASYAAVAALIIIPYAIAVAIYIKCKESKLIRYVIGFGYLLMYLYLLATTTTNLVFCYIIVAFVLLVTYLDKRFLAIIGVGAILANLAIIIHKAQTIGLSKAEITDIEIIFACLLLTGGFVSMAINKIEKINDAHVLKANREKEVSQELLHTTLEVAESITGGIENITAETGHLKDAISQTTQAMNELTSGANDAAVAMEEQATSSGRIGKYIQGVDMSTRNILSNSHEVQGNLEQGSKAMEELMHQVKNSEASGLLVTEKVKGLKEYADRMQEIMGLISNVADQTGLLALNASIEAARAGEAGRGFGVVASEISSLSEQTNAAADDITALIRNIGQSIEEATNAMNLLLQSSQVQNHYVGVAAENFEHIFKITKCIIEESAKLKDAVDVVTKENKHIEENIEHVSAVTEEVTANSEETLDSCNMNLESIAEVVAIMENLREEAKKLKQEG